ncbi:MAG: FecR domain-containing protein, partial [Planctomycetaceae bacterium]|nr:FecR domain-containing protein [Planctomycetaceae bacterium]
PVLKCPESTPIARDSIVRTGATERCEIALDPGNAVRLDCNSEVALREAEVVEVKRGRIWLGCDSERSGVEIQAGGGTIVARKPAQLAVDCRPDATRLMVIDGTARVRTVEGARQVDAGKQVRIVQGKVEDDPEWRDALVETAWVNSLLALRREDHPELVARVDQLLAKIGAVKLSLLYEDELRRLGDGGVPPLLAYLDSTRDTPQIVQRATAARIAADVSETSRIADLIALLTDPHAEVRFHAARGLERLTGRNQGIDPQAWQSQTWAACEPVHQKWIDWWAANRDRYPHARREITSPTSPPF